MKAMQKFLPSLTSVVLVVVMSLALRFTVFAADCNTNCQDEQLFAFAIETEVDLKEMCLFSR